MLCQELCPIWVYLRRRYWWTHNFFLNSQFSSCPLLWMFHSRILNSKINRLHERCMRLIYGNKATSFGELLQQDKTVSCVSLETCKCWPQKCLQFIEIWLLLFSVNYFVDVISAIIFEVIPILQYQIYNLFLMEAKVFPTYSGVPGGVRGVLAHPLPNIKCPFLLIILF